MDNWNPILAETHVKRVPFWQLALGFAVGVATLLATTWGAAVLLFTLERVAQ